MNLKDEINENLWNAIKAHYNAEDYSGALSDAWFLIKGTLQEKGDVEDKDGAKLVDACLSGESPKIKLNNYITTSEKDFQIGIATALKGFYLHARDPQSHDKIVYQQKDADAILIYLDYIYRQLEEVKAFSTLDELKEMIFDESFVNTVEYAEEFYKEIPPKKRYEFLCYLFDNKEDLPKYKVNNIINKIIDGLGVQEKKNFITKINGELKNVSASYSLSMYLHFFASKTYRDLSKLVRLRIEDIILQGIVAGVEPSNKENDKYTHLCVATWVNEIIDLFDNKEQLIECCRRKIFKSKEEQQYVLGFFKSVIDLKDENVLNSWKDTIKKKLPYSKLAYDFLNGFIWTKEDKLYIEFKDEINACEEHFDIKESDKIGEDTPF